MLIGIIGKTNCGKSTFFKACTLVDVEIANRPFVTIKPNHGIGFVKVDCAEKEFNVKCNPQNGFCLNSNRFIPVELLDVAGLVPGAHKGYGLGLEFLNDLVQADALIHIVDISGSTNGKGESVAKFSYDPSNDVKFLEQEIDMWFYKLIKKNFDVLKRKIKAEKKDVRKALFNQFSGLKVTEKQIEEALKESKEFEGWDDEDLFKFSSLLRKKSKPIIIAANKIDIEGSEKNLERLKEEFKDYIIIGCSSEIELSLREAAKGKLINYISGESNFEIIGEINNEQKKGLMFIKDFLKKNKSTGVQDVLNIACFELLKQIVVYPIENSKLTDKDGNILPDAFLMNKGSNALDLAFSVHTDIGNKFVKAMDLRNKRVIGKDYILNNNDVIEIITK